MRLLKWLVVAVVLVGLLGGGFLFYRSHQLGAPPAAELTFGPAPVAQSQDGTADLMPATARFIPAEEGTEVLLQRRAGDGWIDEATAEQDADGVAFFAVPVGADEPSRFRVLPSKQPAPERQSAPVSVRVKEPIFNDDFEGSALNTEKWNYRLEGIRNAKGKRACAESAASMVEVADGAALLGVAEIPPAEAEASDEAVDCPHGEFYNGHIGTQGLFKFRYGVMAARIRFPAQQGQHGAFWSQPDKLRIGAEIDAVEYFGDGFPAKGKAGRQPCAAALDLLEVRRGTPEGRRAVRPEPPAAGRGDLGR